mmetsp:Transcript_115421/g.257916  ORF Transcript_115421/g.257916 Transcript_115421/m.257916 type:complete len:337 (-) Transcript_115421:95-1105(-)
MAEVDGVCIPDLKCDLLSSALNPGSFARIASPASPSLSCGWQLKDLEDALDRHGASEELLVAMATWEAKAMAPQPCSKQMAPLPLKVRIAALQAVEHIVMATGLPVKCWFEAVALLDTYCLRAPVGHSVYEVVLHCIVALRIIDKRNHAMAWRTNTALLNTSDIMDLLWRYVPACGFSSSDSSEEQLRGLERKFLETLEWQANAPSVANWIMVFCTRFNIYTCGAYLPWSNWVWEQCLLHAKALVLWGAVDTELPPRCVAAGLLGLNLVRGKLLSLEALKATEAAPHDRVLEVLEASVMWPREELGEICRRVGLVQMKHVEQMHAKFKLEFGQVSC